MLDKINLDAEASELEWKLGKQYRQNHLGCPAGTDTRCRLYIKAVTPTGSWIAHCFNCGNSGSLFTRSDYTSLTELINNSTEETYDTVKNNTALTINTIKYTMVPIASLEIKAWLFKANTDETDWKHLGLHQYHSNDLIIPINAFSLQIRQMGGGVRYINYFHPDDKFRYFFREGRNATLIITEDVLSAYRCNRDLRTSTVALLGTNLSEVVKCSFDSYFKILIWLDGDAAGKRASMDTYHTLSAMYGSRVKLVVADKSPKEYTPEELVEIYARYK